MEVTISDKDIMEIAKKVVYSEVSSIISSRVDDILTDGVIEKIVQESVENYMKSDEAIEQLRKSFLEEYITEGKWYEYWDIGNSVDKSTSNLIEKIMKSLVFDPEKFQEVCAE